MIGLTNARLSGKCILRAGSLLDTTPNKLASWKSVWYLNWGNANLLNFACRLNNGSTYSTEDGSLVMTSVSTENGTNRAGSWTSKTIHFKTSTSAERVSVSFRAYDGKDFIVFGQVGWFNAVSLLFTCKVYEHLQILNDYLHFIWPSGLI